MNVARDFYLQQLVDSMWDGQVKVITGLRRCGKSYLLKDLFGEYLRKNGVEEDQIILLELDLLSHAVYRCGGAVDRASASRGDRDGTMLS